MSAGLVSSRFNAGNSSSIALISNAYVLSPTAEQTRPTGPITARWYTIEADAAALAREHHSVRVLSCRVGVVVQQGSHHAMPIVAKALSEDQNITPGPSKYWENESNGVTTLDFPAVGSVGRFATCDSNVPNPIDTMFCMRRQAEAQCV